MAGRHRLYQPAKTEEERERRKARRKRHYDRWREDPERHARARAWASKYYFRRTEAQKEKQKEWRRGWYAKNAERLRAKQKEAYATNWRKSFANAQRRRARLLGLPADFSALDMEFALRYWSDACPICGKAFADARSVDFDHWIPLAAPDCPGTIPANMVPLCDFCNGSKHALRPGEFLHRVAGKKAKSKTAAVARFFKAVRQVDTANRRLAAAEAVAV